jgi:CheY-like chemotaxis protein
VGHEINNPLTYVLSNLDALCAALGASGDRRADPSESLRALAEEAMQGADRVRQIVRYLRSFAGTGSAQRRPINVARAAHLAVGLVRGDVALRAQVVLDDAGVREILAPEGVVAQILVSILEHAASFIPPGDREHQTLHTSIAGDDERVQVRVMARRSPASLEHHADAWRVSGRLGPSLAAAERLARELGGRMLIEREVFAITLVLDLPLGDAPAVVPSVLDGASQPVPSLRLLVVDDEPAVARAIERALPGMVVEVCTSGRDALRRCASSAFDAVICDVEMPDGGLDLYDRLCALGLGARVVFVTGGALAAVTRERLAQLDVPKLEKPLDIEQLRDVLVTRLPLVETPPLRGGES